MDERKRVEALRALLLASEGEVPRSGLGRLWRTGRGAAGVAASVVAGRLRGHGTGLGAADLRVFHRLVSQLGELKGLAMKAGQMLGYVDPTLPAEVREVLSVLQTASPASPFVQVEAVLRDAFGERAQVLLGGMERAPVAVASIGQVHRARLPDGTELAVKVRHPGIEEALRSDFRAAGPGSALAGLLVPGAVGNVKSIIDEARTALLEECDFALEAERQRTFGRLFAGDDVVCVPEVVGEWCAPAVLATRWMPGRSLEDFLASQPAQQVRDRLGVALFSFYVGTLYRHGLFHADPHPGNYAVREDGRLVVYDFGCVRTFDAALVRGFPRLVGAVRADDLEAMCGALTAMGATPPADARGRERLRTLLRGFFAPVLEPGARAVHPGAGLEVSEVFQDKLFLARLALPGRFLFLFRLRFGLYAVLARLGAVADWASLESRWAREAEQRAQPSAPDDGAH